MRKRNVAGIILLSFVLLTGCSGSQPTDLGVTEEQLSPCPASPNCVSSFEKDEEHGIDPIQYEGSITSAKISLKAAILTQPRTKIVEESETYIRAESTSFLWRFVDDVEFLFQDSVIHVRSASRIGYGDMGVNRDRIEAIRERFQADR